MDRERFEYQLLNYIIIPTAIIQIILGGLVIIGWYSHNISLIQINTDFVPMQYNTAFGFILCGIGILSLIINFKRIVGICGGIIVSLGILTLIQYIFISNFGIDELFMKHYITVETSNPGRMAPNTALCFALFGFALLIINSSKKIKHRNLSTIILSSLITCFGLVALFGYLSSVNTAYGWGNLTRMAVHTSVGFCLVGISMFFFVWRKEINITQTIFPKWFAYLIGTSSSLGTLAICQALFAKFGSDLSAITYIILTAGILMSVLLVLTIRLAQISVGHSKELKLLNLELEDDISKRKKVEQSLRKLKDDMELIVEDRTKELSEKVTALEDFHDATIDREIRMKELRNEIEGLNIKLAEHKN